MSNQRETDKQKKIKEEIENKKNENKLVTYKYLKEKCGDIRSPIAALLNKEEIRIAGFEKQNKFSSDNIYFEMRLPHKSIQDIIFLFKKLESEDINEYKEGSTELIELFHEKIKDYEYLEDLVIDTLEKNIVSISIEDFLEYMEVLDGKFKGKGYKNVEEFIKELKIVIDNDKIKYDEYLTEKIGFYIYSHWPRESEIRIWKKGITRNKNAQILFLKPVYTHPWVNSIPLSGDLPLYRIKRIFKPFIDFTGNVSKEEFLLRNKIQRLNRTISDSSNLFYKLLFYMEKNNDKIVKNAFLTCLSQPTNDKEEVEHWVIFDRLLNKVEYVPEKPKKTDLNELDESLNDGYNQEYTDRDFYESLGMDQFGRNKKYLGNNESNDMKEFLLFLKETFTTWKQSKK